MQRNRGAHFADASFHSIVLNTRSLSTRSLSARGLLRRQVQAAWPDPTRGRCELRIERWEGQSSCLVVLVHLHGQVFAPVRSGVGITGESFALQPLRDCSTEEMLGKSLGNTSQTSCFVRIVPHSVYRPLLRRSLGPRRLEGRSLILSGSPVRGAIGPLIGPPQSLPELLRLLAGTSSLSSVAVIQATSSATGCRSCRAP